MFKKINDELSVSSCGELFEITIEEGRGFYDREKSVILDKFELISFIEAASLFLAEHENAKQQQLHQPEVVNDEGKA